MEADWDALRAEYVRGGDSYRTLAARHGVPLGRLAARAQREGWAAARRAGGAAEMETDGVETETLADAPSSAPGGAPSPAGGRLLEGTAGMALDGVEMGTPADAPSSAPCGAPSPTGGRLLEGTARMALDGVEMGTPADAPSSAPCGAPSPTGGRLFSGTPLAHLSLAADNVVLLADRAARGLVDGAGRVDLDGLAKVAKILKDARDTQLAVLPAPSGSGGTDDGFCEALNARAAQVWEADGDG